MWAPGTYLPNRDEGDAVHANIGIEKYFFEAGDRILNRIKETRNTAILPERTGPIADVLYSAAGNSADEHWYVRDVIAYSFETGADRYFTTLQDARAAGSTQIRYRTRTRAGSSTSSPATCCTSTSAAPNPETRTVAARTSEPDHVSPRRSRSRTPRARGSRARRCRPASASSRRTRPRASSRRSSSPPATTACSSRRTRTRRTRRSRRFG